MAPGSIFHHLIFYFLLYKFPIYNFNFLFTFFAIFYFLIYKPKIPKILIYRLSIYIRSHFANNCEGIDNPFVALGASWCLFVQVFGGLLRYLPLDWYLGSQKLREILTLLCCITLSSSREKPTQAQEVAGRISGAVAGEIYAKPRHTKYPS